MQNNSPKPKIQDAVLSVQKSIEGIGSAEDKDAVLRACLALNVPAYGNQLSVDPKAF
jgi:hypothetical protein